MATEPEPDWVAWSREAVRLMQERNDAWLARYGLQRGTPYRWDLDAGTLTLDRGADLVVATICLIGTVSVSQGTFLWAWANESIPESARPGLERVLGFGVRHGLENLTEEEWDAGQAEGLEMLAVAGRILDAEGTWVDPDGDLILLFTLSGFRTEEKSA